MKRTLALGLVASLVVGFGCGYNSYEKRLENTLDEMRYIQRLDDSLIPPPEGPFKDFPMYIRPPKGMTLSSNFVMTADLPAGQFDLAASFIGEGAESRRMLHVLARRKAAKPAQQKGAPPPPEPVPQQPFNDAVVGVLRAVYGDSEALAAPQYQKETKRQNAYNRLIFTAANGNIIRVYLYKKDTYDVALIWDTPAGQEKDAAATNARDLTLQSFAVGRKAQNAFAGVGGEGGAEGGGEESATPF